MKRLKCLAAILSIFMLVSFFQPAVTQAASVAPYTILVYMVGSDLETGGGAATDDILEMAAVGSTKNVNVVIETGGAKSWNNKIVSSKVNQRFLVTKDNLKLVKNDLGNRSMGKQSTLQDFLIWGVKTYPAKKYAVVLWDHGAGAEGFGYDEKNPNNDPMLTLNEINGALKAATAVSKQKFELVGFDACLMASIETATSIKDYANYMVASEELEPGHGWNYTPVLQSLNKKPTSTGAELGKYIVDGYKVQANQQKTLNQVTLSVVNLSKVNAINVALEAFIKKAGVDIKDPERIVPLSKARAKAEDYGDAGAHGGTTDMADLYSIANNLTDIYPKEAAALMQSINNSITYKLTSVSKPNANGLSIYFPCKDKGNFKTKLTDYVNTGYLKSYQQFLGTYVQNILKESTAINFSVSVPEVEVEDSQFLISVQVDKGEIDTLNEIYSVLAMFNEDGSVITYLGLDTNVGFDPATGVISSYFDGTWTTLNGYFVYMESEDIGEDYATYLIPVKLNGEDVFIRVLYSEGYPGGAILGAWRGFDEKTGMPDKDLIQIKKGDKILPRYLVYDSNTDEAYYSDGDRGFTVGNTLKLERTVLPDSTYLYGYYVYDVMQNAGSSDFVAIDMEDGTFSLNEE